jgi:hypothetical protein
MYLIYWIISIVLGHLPLIPRLACSSHHYPATHPPFSLLAYFSCYFVPCLPLLSLQGHGSWPIVIKSLWFLACHCCSKVIIAVSGLSSSTLLVEWCVSLEI